MRLQPSDRAPSFSASGRQGETITLEDFSGKPLWLVLSRFAACPWCSLRVDHLSRRHPELEDAGVSLLVVFPSPMEKVERFIMRYSPPFRVAADPDTAAFEAYRNERSRFGQLRSMLDVPKSVRALRRSGGPAKRADIDGPDDRMPCEFLIRGDGAIDRAHYGKALDDGFSVDDVLAWSRALV